MQNWLAVHRNRSFVDTRTLEVLNCAAEGLGPMIGYVFDARPYGRNYIVAEVVPRSREISVFHVRVPHSG